MEYYNFKVGYENGKVVKIFKKIEYEDLEYIKYNKFLKEAHFTNIEENCEYLPLVSGNSVSIVLSENNFESSDLEDIFDVLMDFMGECNEESHNFKWIS